MGLRMPILQRLSLFFCPKVDGSKNAYFPKAMAFVFAKKVMGPKMYISEGLDRRGLNLKASNYSSGMSETRKQHKKRRVSCHDLFWRVRILRSKRRFFLIYKQIYSRL